ncbi:hypothetical protein M153_26180001814 [Pseudoloma neurophilia]|uniref:Uncharacterized protein n=1 Tax=Pseudoloma neurophilia TaxID=146866 RepID=A0A0R0LTU2_9MICR|nr:hypothetical protein M153_26180001814 [Pseudoloma neurophilia]
MKCIFVKNNCPYRTVADPSSFYFCYNPSFVDVILINHVFKERSFEPQKNI